jgi:hypothetical protein
MTRPARAGKLIGPAAADSQHAGFGLTLSGVRPDHPRLLDDVVLDLRVQSPAIKARRKLERLV